MLHYRAAQCASRAQNDALETQSHSTQGCAALRVRMEKKSTEGRDIDVKCIKSVS